MKIVWQGLSGLCLIGALFMAFLDAIFIAAGLLLIAILFAIFGAIATLDELLEVLKVIANITES